MGQKSTILAVGLIVFAVILVLLFVITRVIGVGKNTREEVKTPSTSAPIGNLVPVADIISTPIVYQGYNVDVKSQISSWATNKSFYFTVSIGGGLGGGQKRSLLAVAPQPFQLPQDPNDNKVGLGERVNVTASGTVQILNREQLESVLGVDLDSPSVELSNNNLDNWQEGPVLMINKIVVNSESK